MRFTRSNNLTFASIVISSLIYSIQAAPLNNVLITSTALNDTSIIDFTSILATHKDVVLNTVEKRDTHKSQNSKHTRTTKTTKKSVSNKKSATCASGSYGLGHGNGYKGACCRNQSDCRESCIRGVCNGPSAPTKATKKSAKSHVTKRKTTSKKKPTKKTSSKKKTTSRKKSTKKTSSKKKTTTKKGSSSSSTKFTGDGTYYNTGLGSCGITSKDTDYIVALNAVQMQNGANPNSNPNCGKYVNAKGPKGSVRVKVVDTCPACAKGDLDFSPAAFYKIADFSAGRVSISWSFE